jgi:tetratricopeptide (TPR) repeat protein
MIMAGSLLTLARIALEQPDPEAARSLAAECLVPARELGDKHMISLGLLDLGDAASDLEDYPAAWAAYEESLAIAREIGDRQSIAYSLGAMAKLTLEQGDSEGARALSEESLAIGREIGDRRGIAHSLGGLGPAARAAGEFARSAALYRESMVLWQSLEDRVGIAMGLEDFAGLAGRQQQWEHAVRLLGSAEGVAAPVGRSLPVSWRAEYQRTVDGARPALGEAAFAAAWAAGESLSLEEAVAFAREESHEG